MASKPKYKYFIYKARKRFGNKLINVFVTFNNDVYLTLREPIEKPVVQRTFNEGVFKWEITTYAYIGYKVKKYNIWNDVINKIKFNTILDNIENDFKQM